jgi:hypothetical protein
MSPFRQLSRLYGAVAPQLQALIARDIVRLVDDLFDAAIALWSAAGWHRFDDLEANCTIQVFRWAQVAAGRDAALRVLHVELEWYQPSPAQLAGTESAVGMPRPDIRVSIGAVGVLAECKRLAAVGSLPKAYVDNGIARFVANTYRSETGLAVMVGYLVADTVDAVVPAINQHVDAHTLMGSSHRLVSSTPVATYVALYSSAHARGNAPELRLRHYLCPMAGAG